jgi:outer membrane receptor protein involved in Fe transport
MFDLTAGLNFAYESTDKSKLHMYPHAHLSYTIGEDVMKVYAQLSGNFQKNSYKNITSENPFTGDVIGVANANTKIDLRAGMDVRLDKEISFNGFAAFMRIKNQMFFVNNPQFSTEPITFGAAYDNADVLNLHGEIQLHKNDKAQFYIKGDYFSYSPDSLEKPWYKPSVQFTLSGNYSMQDKIILKADLFYHGSVFIPDYLTEKKYSELNGWFDASLAIEYRYTKVLSVFLNLNNISATRYYRWYNYPSYRFNALAGLTYSF